jgi:thymidylate synthase ThyX
MAYEDAKHRPHAIHTGEEPRNPITNGPESLRVTLDRWGPVDNLFTSMYDALQANWGDEPSRTVSRNETVGAPDDRVPEITGGIGGAQNYFQRTGWSRLYEHERDYVESCFAGKTLQQVLEGVTFDFCIDGVARVFTHQNVRTRLGAGFMQHGGRDNDWRHRAWTMPETMRRACEVHEQGNDLPPFAPPSEGMKTSVALEHCITNWEPIERYLDRQPVFDGMASRGGNPTLRAQIAKHINNGRELYSALVDAGIPWQDARRVLFMGMQTYIHDQYNYLALSGVLANRLEHIMDWEFNCVAQLMLREIKMKCPPLLSKYLGSHSDRAKSARFAGLESWPPDGKYPNPYERCVVCGHSEGNHLTHPDTSDVDVCEVCEREGRYANGYATTQMTSLHKYVGKDTLPRQHRSEQMPFFVLHPDSMAGGPIVWIPTNGKYPHEQQQTT